MMMTLMKNKRKEENTFSRNHFSIAGIHTYLIPDRRSRVDFPSFSFTFHDLLEVMRRALINNLLSISNWEIGLFSVSCLDRCLLSYILNLAGREGPQ